mmetsp:Transcript_3959/g.7117  ORF Transcript_3959/g.7117 Transcript_3959/m.7117 type:complete len:88 (-) Transcript_3959:232-495(-)
MCALCVLNGELDEVVFTPFDLCPYSLVEEHEACLENGIGSCNLGCHRNVFGDEDGHGEGVGNGKDAPKQSLHEGAPNVVGTARAAGL